MSSTQNAPGARHLHPVSKDGIEYLRRFTKPGEDPFDTIQWSWRDVIAGDFRQDNVEAPATWTDQSVGIVAKLYFATIDGIRENSVRTMINRVVTKIAGEMIGLGYFGSSLSEIDLDTFRDELVYALLHQYVTFNSPVWFNVGVPGRKQTCSACFLLSTKDTMVGPDSITDWWAKEATIFKMGAGAGISLSTIRASMEPLSTGGVASGPVAYMRPADAGAGTLKSGGAHRRAAKLVRLDADHPDILDFIQTKVREDARMAALTEAGFNLDPTTLEGERNIAECTSFQNENISVGVTDEFMEMATTQPLYTGWPLRARVSGEVVEHVNAAGVLHGIAEAAWRCADPGLQFDDTINAWHTTPSLGRITTSNPCGETYLNDDSACNLGSLNVLRYVLDDGSFAVDDFLYHVDLMVTAMDATCSFSELPTAAIEKNTRELRQLGLGFSNLGAAIMAQGLPYDSDEGRDFAASFCALLTGRAYVRSAHLAEHLGAFEHYMDNRDTMLGVIERHWNALPTSETIHREKLSIWWAARREWGDARDHGREGFRNSQVTLCQPGGTTSFMLGCDTTGVEPAFSLVTHKSLAGGGTMTMVNGMVARSLFFLGYDDTIVRRINQELQRGAGDVTQFLRPEHQDVFRTAVGDHSIDPMGHVKMVAAVQPFLSQGVSKTVNMPGDCTVEDVEEIYIEAWRMGLKGISIYRDGSKATQVLRSKPKTDWKNGSTIKIISGSVMGSSAPHPPLVHVDEVELMPEDIHIQGQAADMGIGYKVPEVSPEQLKKFGLYKEFPVDNRERMPRERNARVVKFSIDGHEGYLTAGTYEDGRLGEIFLNGIGKDGSTLRGILDAFATDFSIGVQYGVPLETLVRKHAHVTFPPSGPTGDPEVPMATSIVDYIARKLAAMFLDIDVCEELGVLTQAVKQRMTDRLNAESDTQSHLQTYMSSDNRILQSVSSAVLSMNTRDTGQACRQCGGMMQRTGTCYSCPQCFATTGCG